MKRLKLGKSYSSIRREIRSQVQEDLFKISAAETSLISVHTSEHTYAVEPLNVVHTANDAHEQVMNPAYCQPDDRKIDSDASYVTDSSTSFSSSSCEDISDTCIRDRIADWALQFNITQTALSALLRILKPHFYNLPTDPRTLLRTPTNYLVRKLSDGGDYCHLGLLQGISSNLRNGTSKVKLDEIQIQVHVDGLPLFKSSKTTLWTIMGLIKNLPYKNPFVIGMFCGPEKPKCAKELLQEFVFETNDLVNSGFVIESKKYFLKLHSFVCDAPARAYVKGVKQHSGYSSCEKCNIHGDYVGKVIFPNNEFNLRSDASFLAMSDPDHHLGECPLLPIQIGFVSQFGLDYMHLVCLGVMRRLMLYWKGPNGPLAVRLGKQSIALLSERLQSYSPFIPSDFARRPRSMDEILRWKATEFRQFLLYSGIVALKGILPVDLYNHFMLFSISITLLVSSELSQKHCDYAESLLHTVYFRLPNL